MITTQVSGPSSYLHQDFHQLLVFIALRLSSIPCFYSKCHFHSATSFTFSINYTFSILLIKPINKFYTYGFFFLIFEYLLLMHTLCWLYLYFENKKIVIDLWFSPNNQYMGPCSFVHVIFNYQKKMSPSNSIVEKVVIATIYFVNWNCKTRFFFFTFKNHVLYKWWNPLDNVQDPKAITFATSMTNSTCMTHKKNSMRKHNR